MQWIIFGILAIVYDIYWLIDGGAKYLGAQGFMMAAMGVMVGVVFINRGMKEMKAAKEGENQPPPS